MKIFIVTPPEGKRGYECAQDVVDVLKQYVGIEIVGTAPLADVIVVIGGDGTMLYAIQEFQHRHLPFIGLDCGTRGFLMGPVCGAEMNADGCAAFDYIQLPLLDVELTDVNGKVQRTTAFNDAFVKAKHVSTCHGFISGERCPRKKFVGDGIIISTPQGSTAYNHSAGGSILPLSQKILSICTICPMTPRIRSTVDFQELVVEIARDEVVAVADNRCFDHVVKMIVRPSIATVSLGFVRGYNFEMRRYED